MIDSIGSSGKWKIAMNFLITFESVYVRVLTVIGWKVQQLRRTSKGATFLPSASER